jgi:siroheme synthase-like protein
MRVSRGSSLLPLFFDLKGRSAVVFGGGPVGLRKAAYLAREAQVTLIDRRTVEVPEGVRLIVGEAMDHLQLIAGSDIVVAATGDRSVDEMICAEAGLRGKLINRSDGPGNFLIPSVVERRNFTVAISTLGRSPSMSRHISKVIDAYLPSALEGMVDLTEALRDQLKVEVPDAREREGLIRRLLEDPEVWRSLETEPGKALQMARRKVM